MGRAAVVDDPLTRFASVGQTFAYASLCSEFVWPRGHEWYQL